MASKKQSPEITGYEFIITVLSALYRVTYGQVIYNTLRKYNISILKYFKEICDNYIYDNTEKIIRKKILLVMAACGQQHQLQQTQLRAFSILF